MKPLNIQTVSLSGIKTGRQLFSSWLQLINKDNWRAVKNKQTKKQHITTTKFSMNDSCLSVHQGVILMDKNTKLNWLV